MDDKKASLDQTRIYRLRCEMAKTANSSECTSEESLYSAVDLALAFADHMYSEGDITAYKVLESAFGEALARANAGRIA